jgi:hypothetical protein
MGLYKLWTAVESKIGSSAGWHIREAFDSTIDIGMNWDQLSSPWKAAVSWTGVKNLYIRNDGSFK